MSFFKSEVAPKGLDFTNSTMIVASDKYMTILTVTPWCLPNFSLNALKIFDLQLSFIRHFLTVIYFLYLSCYSIRSQPTVNYMPYFLTVSAMYILIFNTDSFIQLNQHLFMVYYVYLNCSIMLCCFSPCFSF